MARVTPQDIRDLGIAEGMTDEEIMTWIKIANVRVDLIKQRAPELRPNTLETIELLYAAHLIVSRPGGEGMEGIESISQESFSISFDTEYEGGFLDLVMELDPTDTINPERRNLRYDVETVDSR